jgi:CBS domain-containing protein
MGVRLFSQQRISDVLDGKGRRVLSVSNEATVCAAVQVMIDNGVGSVVVTKGGGAPIGMLSDRDVMTRIVATSRSPTATRVSEVMSEMVTIAPDAGLVDAMRLMTQRRVRHLPVLGPSGLDGLVSIGDITKALAEAQQSEIEQLESYISGPTVQW